MEAHIDDVSLGTNTPEDHVLLLCELFIVCQESHLRIKLEKCEFMKEEMEYLGFDVGYCWWKPAASKMQPLRGGFPRQLVHNLLMQFFTWATQKSKIAKLTFLML